MNAINFRSNNEILSEEQIIKIEQLYSLRNSPEESEIDRLIVEHKAVLAALDAKKAEEEAGNQEIWDDLQGIIPKGSSLTSQYSVFDEKTVQKEQQTRKDESALEEMTSTAKLSTGKVARTTGENISAVAKEVWDHFEPPAETQLTHKMKQYDKQFEAKMTDVKARQEEQKKLDINSLNIVAQEITRNINKEVTNPPQEIENQLLLYKNACEICNVLLSFGCQVPLNAKRNEFRDRIKEIEDALKTKRGTG